MLLVLRRGRRRWRSRRDPRRLFDRNGFARLLHGGNRIPRRARYGRWRWFCRDIIPWGGVVWRSGGWRGCLGPMRLKLRRRGIEFLWRLSDRLRRECRRGLGRLKQRRWGVRRTWRRGNASSGRDLRRGQSRVGRGACSRLGFGRGRGWFGLVGGGSWSLENSASAQVLTPHLAFSIMSLRGVRCFGGLGPVPLLHHYY